MINKIGVENFRVFKDYTEFELRPLTLLTGPNNAGKSSLTKLLLLLNNGFQKLNFNKGKHNLEDYFKILNWDKNSYELLINIDYQNNLLDEEFYCEFIYNYADLNGILIKNNEVTLLKFTPYLIDEDEEEEGEYEDQYQDFTLSFNINYLIDMIYSYKINLY